MRNLLLGCIILFVIVFINKIKEEFKFQRQLFGTSGAISDLVIFFIIFFIIAYLLGILSFFLLGLF